MRSFKRGLFDSKAREDVKRFLDSETGAMIKADDKYQVSIRENYINIYYCGCSLLKYEPLKGKTGKYSIHSKYVSDRSSDAYVTLEESDNDLIFDCNGETVSFRSDVLMNPKRVAGYIRGEKEHLAKYVMSQKPFLLDLEVAFTREVPLHERKNPKRAFVANRIDMAVINSDFKLQMIEVKIDSDGRLRSEVDGKQEVLKQMRYYKTFLADELENIKSSYQQIAKDYLALGLAGKFHPVNAMDPAQILERFAEKVSIDAEPYLLIIDTGANMIGKQQVDHYARLSNQLTNLDFQDYVSWCSL